MVEETKLKPFCKKQQEEFIEKHWKKKKRKEKNCVTKSLKLIAELINKFVKH